MSKSVKVGIFLVGGALLFCVGLFLVGSRENLFGSYFTVYTEFRDINTLENGSKVRVAGMSAGQITAITVPRSPSQSFRLKLKVDKKFAGMIRSDSFASIDTEGMVGSKFVNISEGGARSSPCHPGCTLPSKESVSMGALMQQGKALAANLQSTIQDLHHRADAAMENITSATGNANKLMTGMTPRVLDATSNIDEITGNIRRGHGAAGKLLSDRKVAQDVQDTIANARNATAQLNSASAKVNQMAGEVKQNDLPRLHQTLSDTADTAHRVDQAVGTFLGPGKHNENTAAALRDTIQQARNATANLASDTEAIKHNFFFRGFFNRRGFYNMEVLTPQKYMQTKFVKHPKIRVWIPAAGLFTTGEDGAQQLSKQGRSILNERMSALVPYLPNNPIMVEGYSTAGSPDQQYLVSRQRAVEVRNYLDSHFHLHPKRVGIMPLAGAPPPHAGKTQWDGVCLALVISRK